MNASDRTKQLLANGLKELAAVAPLRKIRVGELCARCGVDRRTFYYHFRDIYDLAAWIFDQIVDSHIPFEKEHSYQRGVELGLTQIWKDEVFFRCALAEDSQNALGRYMLKHMNELYVEALRRDQGRETLTTEERFTISYHCFGCLGMVRRWLFYEREHSPKELAALFYAALPPILSDMYRHAEEKEPHPSSGLRESPDAAFPKGEGCQERR